MTNPDDRERYAGSRAMSERARQLIPGGSHTYAKGDDQFPVGAPGFIARGKGCHVWDVDGNEFIEYGMGLRAVSLGHAYEPVVQAAMRHLDHGTNYSRPAPVEVACADRFLQMIKGAEQVKFTKDGSTAITAAARLARAFTGRNKVAYCADHPFFSYNDWFIGGFEMSAGIPAEHRSLVTTFHYNDLESLRRVFADNPGQIACILMEPERETPPADGFLEKARDLAHENGALLIFDEMITGFRWHKGGAQTEYGITPDLSGFGKALANGFSVSALAGRREIMELGGFSEDRDRVFLLSTTHGAETHALAAAIATMNVYEQEDVIGTLHRQGKRLREGCNAAAAELGLGAQFEVLGRDSNLVYATRDRDGNASQEFRTLFMQEMIARGILGPSFVVSYSHDDDDIDRTIEATREALKVYRRGIDDGVDTVLEGRPVRPVDRRRG
ncbi:glutamate-1-semialdehyde 2,1-aminomutase [bacterium]|nr:MAG: glutamate-1-semialdehyde 2,1-aminomutase [bacterium]